jgi:hypothetical protein
MPVGERPARAELLPETRRSGREEVSTASASGRVRRPALWTPRDTGRPGSLGVSGRTQQGARRAEGLKPVHRRHPGLFSGFQLVQPLGGASQRVWLDALPVDLDLSGPACLLGFRSGPVQARDVEPDVQPGPIARVVARGCRVGHGSSSICLTRSRMSRAVSGSRNVARSPPGTLNVYSRPRRSGRRVSASATNRVAFSGSTNAPRE